MIKAYLNVNEGVSFKGKEIQINGDGRVQEIAFMQEIKNDRVHLINEELGIAFSLRNSEKIESISIIVCKSQKHIIVNYDSNNDNAKRCCVTCNGWTVCGDSACCDEGGFTICC